MALRVAHQVQQYTLMRRPKKWSHQQDGTYVVEGDVASSSGSLKIRGDITEAKRHGALKITGKASLKVKQKATVVRLNWP